MRFYIYTSGCKINQYESQSLREAWLKKGWTEVEQSIAAEVILINSCAVTHRAVQDVRKMTRRFYRQNNQSKIIITGCAARIFSEDLGSLPGVRALVPQENKDKLKQLPLEEHGVDYWTSGKNEQLKYPDFNISDYPRARPVIKTQDGCSRFCSYCIVPYTRGPARSRSPEDIRQEIDGLIERGFQEVVLSGINLAQYRTNIAVKNSLESQSLEDLGALVINLDEKRSSLRQELSGLEKDLESIKAKTDEGVSLTETLKNQIMQLQIIAGKRPVKGPGVSVTITGESLLMYYDLIDLVNELFNAGAEAVSINDVRIKLNTQISEKYLPNDQQMLLINGEQLLSPIIIKAIGDPDTLDTDIHARRIHHREHAAHAGILVSDEPARRAGIFHGAGRRPVDAQLML